MRKYVFAILIIISATSFTSFMHKKLNPVTFYYVIGNPDQRIESGFTGITEHSITCLSYTNLAYWTTIPQAADTWSGDGSSYLKSITIDDYEPTCDGDDDGKICLAEALAAICSQYIQSSLYPSLSDVVTVNAPGSGSGSATISTFTRADHANVP